MAATEPRPRLPQGTASRGPNGGAASGTPPTRGTKEVSGHRSPEGDGRNSIRSASSQPGDRRAPIRKNAMRVVRTQA